MSELYVLSHLGMGDHLICNGLIRRISKNIDLLQIPCYLHNYQSVQFMYRDLPNILPIAINDESDAKTLANDRPSLRLGYYSSEGFDPDHFDTEFYRQASIPFKDRWDNFYVDLNSCLNHWDKKKYAFVHDDPERGFAINSSLINFEIKRPIKIDHIFHNYSLLRDASEIHCINSSFLILVDSLPEIEDQKLFLHHYARPTVYPLLKKKWTIV